MLIASPRGLYGAEISHILLAPLAEDLTGLKEVNRKGQDGPNVTGKTNTMDLS